MIYLSLPFTNYQMRKIKTVSAVVACIFAAVVLIGNLYNICVKQNITVSKDAYDMINGLPFFTSQEDYIEFVSSYPYNAGVNIRLHTISLGESLWDVCRIYGVDIDTIIAANPFLTDFSVSANTKVAVPVEKGVLFAFDDYFDVVRMARQLNYAGEITGDYKPSLLHIISSDDIRLVFFKDAKPVALNLNPRISKLYAYRQEFASPVHGRYTSLFGNRIDPFTKTGEFHNGLDIQSVHGRPIHAARRGVVSFSGWRGGYGKTLVIMHDEGYISMYAHCSQLSVKRGDIVDKGTVIGYVGSTGRSTGPHLHFSVVHHGRLLNPMILLW